MKEKIDEARKTCAAVLANFYQGAGLLADMLSDSGEYRSFWETSSGKVLKATSANIFDGQSFTAIYELQYKCPLGWPIAS